MSAATKRTPTKPRVQRDEAASLPPLDGDLEPDEHGTFVLDESPGYDDAPDDGDLGSGLPISGGDRMLDDDEQSGWLEGADDADDLDVGGLDDPGIEGGASYVDPHTDTTPGAEPLDDDEIPPETALDDGEEGPLDEGVDAPEEQPPLGSGDDDEGPMDPFDGLGPAATREPPRAWSLPPPSGATHVSVRTEGVVLAAVALDAGARALLVGDGVWSLALPVREALAGRARTARRVARAEPGEIATSVIAPGPRVVVMATSRGRILRSEDAGATHELVATLGEDDEHAAVELWADPETRDRVWARAHAGGLFRSDDGGRTWDGPVVASPVRAAAVDPSGGGLVASTASWPPSIVHSRDGKRFDPVDALRLEQPATVAAVRGDLWAFAFASGPGRVSADAGRSSQPWPLLAHATALALVEADDGASQLLAAVYDDVEDRATLVVAGIDRAGRSRGARRWLDLASSSPTRVEDEPEHRVDAIVPLDPAARRVLVVTASGVVLAERA